PALPANVGDAMIRDDRGAESRRLAEERVEHVARSVRVGEEFAVGLFVERHAEVTEELRGAGGRKRPQHATDDGRAAAPEIPFGDDRVGDVAARAAADEDLRAGARGAVGDDERERCVGAAGKDGGGEAGGAGADHGDIAAARRRRSAGATAERIVRREGVYAPCHSTAKRRKSAAKSLIIDSTSARGFAAARSCAGSAAGATSKRPSSSSTWSAVSAPTRIAPAVSGTSAAR